MFTKKSRKIDNSENTVLTVEKRSRERSVNFPIVIVNFLWDLKINNNKTRVCVGLELYHFVSYAASPIVLLCTIRLIEKSNYVARKEDIHIYIQRCYIYIVRICICIIPSHLGAEIFSSVTKNKRFQSDDGVKKERLD